MSLTTLSTLTHKFFQLSSQDDELVRWVEWQCKETLGFSDDNFTGFLINIAQTSDTVASLRSRLRNQVNSTTVTDETSFDNMPCPCTIG